MTAWEFGQTAHTLRALAEELGPERFVRLWRSPKPLDESYFDVTGVGFASWVRKEIGGAYRAGPSTPATSTSLTLLAAVALFVVASRGVPRPRMT